MSKENEREESHVLDSLLESRDEGMALVDAEARFLYCNSAYAAFMKDVFNLEVKVGMRHPYVLPGGQGAWASEMYQSALTGKKFSVEFSSNCKEHGTCYYERSFSPTFNKGKLSGFSEVIRDVTEHKQNEDALRANYKTLEKQFAARTSSYQEYNAILAQEIVERQQAEEDLQESKERLAQILQGSSIPTFVIDNTHTITHWNKACESVTGYSYAEMVGSQNQWKAFYLHQRPTMADLVLDMATDDEIARYYAGKYRSSEMLKDAFEAEDFFDFGKRGKWLFFTAAPIRNRAGEVIGAIETLQDISDRKQMEEEIRKINDELEERVDERTMQLKLTYDQLLHAEKLSAVGKLAASIAHEFGNPIIGIRNFLKGLKTQVELPEDDAAMLDLAIDECVRVKDLIQSLQDFNRPTTGKVDGMDIHKTIDDLLVFSKKSLSDKNIQVLKSFAPDMVEIQAVADQIKQVILNLIGNAQEAIGPSGGRIIISTEVVQENIHIHVEDTGKGIAEKDIDYIFDPFYSTKPAVEGTGLGLSVSYGIVKRHGGNITVQSTPDLGSKFTITLPIDGVPQEGDSLPVFK